MDSGAPQTDLLDGEQLSRDQIDDHTDADNDADEAGRHIRPAMDITDLTGDLDRATRIALLRSGRGLDAGAGMARPSGKAGGTCPI
jgi:hypothetical protein